METSDFGFSVCREVDVPSHFGILKPVVLQINSLVTSTTGGPPTVSTRTP